VEEVTMDAIRESVRAKYAETAIKLRDGGLVEVTKVGIWAYYRLADHLEPRTRALIDVLV
jgi:DNA-binding transcriptional ArsR family regulator